MNKKIKVGEKNVNLSIWDTAGQERFHALGLGFLLHLFYLRYLDLLMVYSWGLKVIKTFHFNLILKKL